MPSVEQSRFEPNKLALIARALTFIALARAPLNYCGIESIPYIFGASAVVVIASLLTMRRRLAGTSYKLWPTCALAVVWLDLALRMTGQFVAIPRPLLIVAACASSLITPLLAWVVARLAAESEEWKACRLFKRAAWACVVGWGAAWVVAAVWSEATSHAREASWVAFAVVAVLCTSPYFLILVADSAIGGATSRGTCLNCGYSLTGLTTATCPECGKGLQFEPKVATRPIARVPWQTIALHTLLAVCVIVAGSYAMPDNGLHRFKPLWMLMRECKLGPGAFSSHGVMNGRGGFPPMWEIDRRAQVSSLDSDSVRLLVGESLRVQNDPLEALYLWPQVFTHLDARGLVTEMQREQFEQNLMRYSLKLPKSVPEEGHLSFKVIVDDRGPGSLAGGILPVRTWSFGDPMLERMTVDGVEVLCPQRRANVGMGGSSATFDFTPAGTLPRLPRGTGTRHIRIDFTVNCWRTDGAASTQKPTKKTVTLEGDVNVTAAPTISLAVQTDPAMVRALIERWNWGYESNYAHRSFARNGLVIEAPDNEAAMEFDFIADVIVLDGLRETAMGRLVIPAGKREAFVSDVHSWAPDSPNEKMELLIRPTNPQFESVNGAVWAGEPFRVKVVFSVPGAPNKPPTR